MKTNHIVSVAVLLIVLALPMLAHAQFGMDDDVVDVPIDGGFSLLLAAGVGYGAKKVNQYRKEKQPK